MYSKELEELIEAAIADGVITAQEQAVLIRKAQQEGIDPNELAVVVNGRLEKNRQQKKAADEKKKADSRVGSVLKCPQCGAVVNRMMGKCPECGHVFTGVSAGMSVKSLTQEIKAMSIVKKAMGGEVELIRNFPIPNSKDELMDLMLFLKNYESQYVTDSSLIDNKLKESVDRCRVLFKDDPEVNKLVGECEQKIKKSKKSKSIKYLFSILSFLLIIGGCTLGLYFMSMADEKKEENVDLQLQNLSAQIDALPAPSASNYEEVSHKILKIVWTPIDASEEKVKTAIHSFVNKKNGYIRAINALGLGDPLPEDAVGNYLEGKAVVANEDDTSSDETYSKGETTKNEIQQKVDEQYENLHEQLETIPEVDADNYEDVVAEIAALLWIPITDEAETAKKTFKSPSKDEKYERKIKNQWYNEVKAKARKINAFYKKNTETLGEIDNTDLEKLVENGFIE